jgi:hypothetical protein
METIEIVGIEASNNGRCCNKHVLCCGSALVVHDLVVRLRKVQILNTGGEEETAIAAHWISDGLDQCRVGFLKRSFVPEADQYDGVVAQIFLIYSKDDDHEENRKKWKWNHGCCLAAVIGYPQSKNAISSSLNKTEDKRCESDDGDDDGGGDGSFHEEEQYLKKRKNTTASTSSSSNK